MKKTILLFIFLVFVLSAYAVLHMCWIEPAWFEVTKTDISVPPEKILDKQIKILHLSDFHAGDSVSYSLIEKAVDLGIKEKPDIIFITGDFVTGKLKDPEAYGNLLRKLSAAAPVFACLGNHDGGSWTGKHGGYKDSSEIEKLLRKNGIMPLINQSCDIEIKGNKLGIIGLGDLWSEELFLPGKILRDKDEKSELLLLLLVHNPDSKKYLIPYAWDIMFCGHTHGGQLVLPLTGSRPFVPIRNWDFVEGLYHWDSRYIYITRGVGNLHGKRFNCRPEISIITLRK